MVLGSLSLRQYMSMCFPYGHVGTGLGVALRPSSRGNIQYSPSILLPILDVFCSLLVPSHIHNIYVYLNCEEALLALLPQINLVNSPFSSLTSLLM